MIGVQDATYVQPTGIDFHEPRNIDPDALGQAADASEIGEEIILESAWARLSNEKNYRFHD